MTNGYLDTRNLVAYKCSTTLEDENKIKKKLNYFFDYYNPIAESDSNNFNSLNIIIANHAGSGKSTLQNKL